ncbi:MAG: hypothetical protein C0402_10045 [Thermodesulfovibrio sp.]|nr:hypothetical protein [Thermodesulfovibrio sp.]
MTVLPFQFNEVVRLYNRVSKLNPTTLLEKEHGEPQDIVSISAEGKKKQILAQTKNEVLERIKEAM